MKNNFENPAVEIKIINELLSTGMSIEYIVSFLKQMIPIQYLAKYTYIKNIKILFEEKVLLPGPEMDIMIDFTKRYLHGKQNILDLCTGCGCIVTIIAQEFPDINFYAIDITEDAIRNTKKNIELYNLRNVKLFQGDLFDPIEVNKISNIDVIICNPPFCKTEEIENISEVVKNNVPMIAIDGGDDGLYFYKKIFSNKWLDCITV